jgi:chromosome segregation ATPase
MGNEAERIASLEARLAGMETVLMRLEAKLDAYQSQFTPRQELYVMLEARDEKIKDLREEIDELKREKQAHKQAIPNWVSSLIAAGALAFSIFGTTH